MSCIFFVNYHFTVGNKITVLTIIVESQEQLCIEYPVAEEITGALWRSLLVTGATLGLLATILSVTA